MSTPPGQWKEECKGKEAFKARSAMPGLAEEASRSALARSSDPCTLEQAQLQGQAIQGSPGIPGQP